jgi:hypothetical protein
MTNYQIHEVRFCPNPTGQSAAAQELRRHILSVQNGTFRIGAYEFVARGGSTSALVVEAPYSTPAIFKTGALELATVEVESFCSLDYQLVEGTHFFGNSVFCRVQRRTGAYNILVIAASVKEALQLTDEIVAKKIVMDGKIPN